MATVRFSDDLKNTILLNASRMFTLQKETAVAATNPMWGQRIYELAFADFLTRTMGLPVEWFRELDGLTVTYKGPSGTGVLQCPISPAAYAPQKVEGTGIARGATNIEWHYADHLRITIDGHIPEWREIYQELIDYQRGIDEASQAEAKFVHGVKEVLTSFATLAPALKTWPPLWDLVPEETKRRHREIVARKTTPTAVNADLDNLTATVVRAKLTK